MKNVVLSPRDQLLKNIYDIHHTMRDIVLAAGVPEQHYEKPIRNLEEKTNEELIPLFDWLKAFSEGGPYSNVLNIWRLKPPAWWYNMETLFQQRKTREQKLLNFERRKLRKAWYKRYGEPEAQGQESVENAVSSDPA